MKILVTGSAGFIGSALTLRLLARGDEVIGIDNHNDYYDPKLKATRLKRHIDHPNYTHVKLNIGIVSKYLNFLWNTIFNIGAPSCTGGSKIFN